MSITADNGTQLVSAEFKKFCDENNIILISTTPYWPQQNGEVERQNRSILKRLIISQSEKKDWKQDLLKYLLMYRSTPHSTTMKTPSELIFGRTIRDKLPNINQPVINDEEMRDQDLQSKQKGKEYTDKKRHAKSSEIEVGDTVLLKKMVRANKLAPIFEPIPHEVIERKGGELVVKNTESNVRYRRNVSHALKVVSCRCCGYGVYKSKVDFDQLYSFYLYFILYFQPADNRNTDPTSADVPMDSTAPVSRPKRNRQTPIRYTV